MLDDYTFGQSLDKPIRRKKKWNYGFYFPEFEFEDEEEYLEEYVEEDQNKINKEPTVKTRKKVQKKK